MPTEYTEYTECTEYTEWSQRLHTLISTICFASTSEFACELQMHSSMSKTKTKRITDITTEKFYTNKRISKIQKTTLITHKY